MTDQQTQLQSSSDGKADALVAVVLVLVFVAASIFWISGQ